MNHSERSPSFCDEFLAALDSAAPAAGIEARSNLRVLDVGTGTARIPIEICRRRTGFGITVVDRAQRALERARQNVSRAGLGHAIRIERAAANLLPFADASFDAVISNGLLHHVPRRIGALREMARVLRPGGLLFVRDSLRQSDAAQIAGVLAGRAERTDERRRKIFESSFRAALTFGAARVLLREAGLPAEWVRHSGPVHWAICGRL